MHRRGLMQCQPQDKGRRVWASQRSSRPHTSNCFASAKIRTISKMAITASQATVRVQSMARVSVQPLVGAGVRVTPCRFAFSSRLHTTKSLGQSRPRQIITMAENPISKAVESVKEAAEEFGDEVKSNAKDTAKKTEAAYQDANPEESDEKPPTDQYRSTQLKNSDNKYTPKSDPKK